MDGKQNLQSDVEKATATKCYDGLKKEKMPGPDGGMAWVVAFACCMINFIMAGLGRMSGILFVAFIEVYGVDRKSASMPFSVRSSAGNLFGPVVGILGQKYGARKIIIIGGIIGTISSAACFFAPDVTWITVLWGGVSGLGSALTVTLPQVVIGQYFEKHRTTAAGIAFSGGCVGSFVFPMLLDYLLDNFGIEATFLIMGAIIMNTIPAALILKKPSWLNPANQIKTTDELSKSSKNNIESFASTKLALNNCLTIDTNANVCSVNEFAPKKTPGLFRESESHPDLGLLKSFEHIDSFSALYQFDKIKCLYENLDVKVTQNERDLFVKLTDKDVIERSGLEFPRVHLKNDTPIISSEQSDLVKQLADLVNLEKAITNIPQEKVSLGMVEVQKFTLPDSKILNETVSEHESPNESSKVSQSGTGSLLCHIKTAFKLYANPLFIMVCLCRAVHFIAFIPAMTTVVDFSMDKGLLEDEARFAIAAISMGDLFGRLCFGWVTDRGFMTLPKYMMTVMIAQGISTASLPLMNTKLTIFSNLALFGMLQGSLFVRHSVLISKYMKSDEQSIAMGCVNFISGIIGFGLPIYIGFFRDTMESYDYIFYLNGLLGACVGLLWIFEPFFVRCADKRVSQKLSSV